MIEELRKTSNLFGGNAPFIEDQYEIYLSNPGAVSADWRAYFDAMQHMPAVDGSEKPDVDHSSVIASFAERAKQGPIRTVTAAPDVELGRKRVAVTQNEIKEMLHSMGLSLGMRVDQPAGAHTE